MYGGVEAPSSAQQTKSSSSTAAAIEADIPTRIGAQFVTAYYKALATDTENLYTFYEDDSTLTRVMDDRIPSGTERFVGQLQIHQKVTQMGYQNCKVKVDSTDVMESVNGGVVVLVTGTITLTNTPTRSFVQTFILQASAEEGEPHFYVRNDIFRLLPNNAAAAPKTYPTKATPNKAVKPQAAAPTTETKTATTPAPATTTAPATTNAAPVVAATTAPVQQPASPTKAPRSTPAKATAAAPKAAETAPATTAAAPAETKAAAPEAAKTTAAPATNAAAPAKPTTTAPVAKPTGASTPAAKPTTTTAAAPAKLTSWASRASVGTPASTTAAATTPAVVTPTPVTKPAPVAAAPKPTANAGSTNGSASPVEAVDDGFKTVGRSQEKKNATPRTQGGNPPFQPKPRPTKA